ncbi:MAG TPA: pseudouridine synthase [Bryobacteraceae bacterium]|jgi:23S rRNA pseudouridine2457 synthase|nr:pseudouridine synthase [Bryobacteraceae bacterium]
MPFRYVVFNKPYQVLSQFTAGSVQRRTLADFVPVPGIYPVGRLDYDSEGLLLLTDDGKLQHRLSDPRFAHPRTYWVQVEGQATCEACERLSGGLNVRDYHTRPCQARLLAEPQLWARNPPIRYRKNIATSWIEITLTEGRNRQVRHMTAAIGFPTLRLVRVALGSLRLEGLTPGEWKLLSEQEVKAGFSRL